MKKEPYKLLGEIRTAETELEQAKRRFLQSMGFSYTCDTNALWLWGKEIDGKTVRLSEAGALNVAESECLWPYQGEAEHPEGYDGECGCDLCMSYA